MKIKKNIGPQSALDLFRLLLTGSKYLVFLESPFNQDYMQVKSKAKLVDGLDDHLGSYAIAVPSIRQGYR